MIIVLILFFILLFFSLAVSKNNIFSPVAITTSIWIFCFLLFLTLDHKLPPLSNQFLIAIVLWVTLLSFSSMLFQAFRITVDKDREVSQLVRNIYFLVSIFTYPMLIYFAYNAIKYGDSDSWTANLRLSAIGGSSISKEVYFPLYLFIWLSSYLIELMYVSKKNIVRIFVLGFFYLSFGFFTMSKTVFLNLFILTICVLYFKKIVSIKHLLIGIGILFLILLSLQNLRLASKSDKSDFLVLYMLSSMSAFDTLQPSTALHWGENVFRFFYKLFYNLGFSDIKQVSAILPWIKKPILTNTYTGMYPFFVDFGYKGIIFSSIVLGSFLGWIFNKAKKYDKLFILIYAYFANCILMQYVGDMFFTYIGGHIKFLIILILPFILSKYKLFNSKK